MLHIEQLPNSKIKMTADSGHILDKRNDRIYSTVIAKAKDQRYFSEYFYPEISPEED